MGLGVLCRPNGLEETGEDVEEGEEAGQEEELSVMDRQHLEFLGDATCYDPYACSLVVDDNKLLPEGLTVELLGIFEQSYQEHCEV